MDFDVSPILNNVLIATSRFIKIHNRIDSKQRESQHRWASIEHNIGHQQAHRYKHPVVIEKLCRARLDGKLESTCWINAKQRENTYGCSAISQETNRTEATVI